MKVFIRSPGDRSVGIPDGSAVINIEGVRDDSVFDGYGEEGREARDVFRDRLRIFWSEFWGDGPVQVTFEDECPDCYHRRQPGESCANPDCFGYEPVPAEAD